MSTALMEMEADCLTRPARRSARGALEHNAADVPAVRPRARAAADDIAVRYQPRFRLATGFQTGAEAVLRGAPGKPVPPPAFAPGRGRGADAGACARVLNIACAEAARWGGIGVCVNVSAEQFRDAALLRQVGDALDDAGLAPDLLELGLTEAMLGAVDMETLLALSAIRDLGVGLVLDGFGAGPGTLGMLKRLPLTGLKLDRALVRELPRNTEDAAIVRAIIDTGHALDFIIVADGVESEAQRACLDRFGCEEGQGALFSRALSAEEMRARLGVD